MHGRLIQKQNKTLCVMRFKCVCEKWNCENQNKVQRPGQQEDFLNSPAPFSSLSSTFPSSCCVFSSCRDSPLHSERSSTRSSSPSASSVCWSPSWPCRRTSWWCRAGSGRAAAAGSSLQREEQKKVCKDFKSDAFSQHVMNFNTLPVCVWNHSLLLWEKWNHPNLTVTKLFEGQRWKWL